MKLDALRRWVTRFGIAAACLVAAGCEGGGGVSGVIDSVFGGGSGDSGSTVLAALDSGAGAFSGGSSGGSTGGGTGGLTGGGSVPSIATVSNPEPGSMVLFGSGLALTFAIRRRKSRERTARS